MEARAIVRQAMAILTPAVPARMEDGHQMLTHWTRKIIVEEGHTVPQLVHILHLIVQHFKVCGKYERVVCSGHCLHPCVRKAVPCACACPLLGKLSPGGPVRVHVRGLDSVECVRLGSPCPGRGQVTAGRMAAWWLMRTRVAVPSLWPNHPPRGVCFSVNVAQILESGEGILLKPALSNWKFASPCLKLAWCRM